jgi:protein gp37
MSDLFHARVSLKFIQQVFEVIKKCPQHTFQILTKRPRRMLELSPQLTWHPNIWMGVSVESQKYCDRIDILKQIPATVRFLSCEPLLGPLDLNLDGIQWVIVGGESGAKHRPMKEEWALDIRDQCQLAKVPFFFKQWGTVKPKNRTLENKFWDEMPRSRFAEQKAANH